MRKRISTQQALTAIVALEKKLFKGNKKRKATLRVKQPKKVERKVA